MRKSILNVCLRKADFYHDMCNNTYEYKGICRMFYIDCPALTLRARHRVKVQSYYKLKLIFNTKRFPKMREIISKRERGREIMSRTLIEDRAIICRNDGIGRLRIRAVLNADCSSRNSNEATNLIVTGSFISARFFSRSGPYRPFRTKRRFSHRSILRAETSRWRFRLSCTPTRAWNVIFFSKDISRIDLQIILRVLCARPIFLISMTL